MNLKIGDRGNNVKLLQEKLGLKTDGVFGPVTQRKLREWQKTNGFGEDGVANLEVFRRLGIETVNLNLNALKGHIPDLILAQIPETAAKFNITTNLRLAHFLSQCSHESGNFRVFVENLNYSSDGLIRIFRKYFPGNLNESYARQPERIANRVYSNRMGNGDEASGDGWRYRGRGAIQLTGKSNYASFDKFVDDDILANPDLVATKYTLASAAWFFDRNKLWTICDRGSSDQIVTRVSRRVNGGTIGLSHRISEFRKIFSLLNQ